MVTHWTSVSDECCFIQYIDGFRVVNVFNSDADATIGSVIFRLYIKLTLNVYKDFLVTMNDVFLVHVNKSADFADDGFCDCILDIGYQLRDVPFASLFAPRIKYAAFLEPLYPDIVPCEL